MLNNILGIPAHPLIIHAAVVFIPLLCLGAVVYAVVPRFRGKIGWAVLALAVISPIAAWFAKASGENLRDRLVAAGFSPEILDKVNQHQSYGDRTWWFTLALGVVTLVMLFVNSGNRRAPHVPVWVNLAMAVVVIALAVATAIYVFLTGDSGAHAVWEGAVP
ncbi:DUF2231 domain-containing protein [Asanoa siamensis]|uniref:DUF2231 domain-containing protein n=1 Tax=Asanoa siamensis TaxID=926357 RepID=A0ABQ4CH42_9ACTN|nr:DUF2231 domain-containing protein [Asanoa siamensis]GIF70609.1 hypothetical protein Asi02nite_01270 [Asanoa siamensis]